MHSGTAMRRGAVVCMVLASAGVTQSCTGPAPQAGGSAGQVQEEIVALERAALDRWITLDPQGYLDLYAPDVSYFDPTQDARVDGLEAMTALYAPLKDFKSPITEPRYEMIAPTVRVYGDVALLTFNLVSYGRQGDAPEAELVRWNSTELYRRIDGAWKIAHSHWSFVKPPRPQPPSP